MSRRRCSATALNASEVVAARGIRRQYMPIWAYVKTFFDRPILLDDKHDAEDHMRPRSNKHLMRLNPNLLKATAVGALGGLLFGFDTAVIAGTTHSLTIAYALTPRQLGLTVSMALIGTVIGAMSAGVPGQKYGARETLRLLAVFYVLSALGCAFAWNWDSLLLA